MRTQADAPSDSQPDDDGVTRVEATRRERSDTEPASKLNEVRQFVGKHPRLVAGTVVAAGTVLVSPVLRVAAFRLGSAGVKLYAAKKLAEAVGSDEGDQASAEASPAAHVVANKVVGHVREFFARRAR